MEDSSAENVLVPINYIDKVTSEVETGKQKYLALEEQHKKTSDKLKFALSEIEILNKQLKKEKEIFHEAFEHLKDTSLEQKYQTMKLKEKYNELEKFSDVQSQSITSKDQEIEQLKLQLDRQKKCHRKLLTEKDIHAQQERYIAQHYYCNT